MSDQPEPATEANKVFIRPIGFDGMYFKYIVSDFSQISSGKLFNYMY